MLPKSCRLARPDFLQTKKLGKSLSFPHFSAIIYDRTLNTENRIPGRVAIVTSTKLSKSAVIRNRLRRQIYSSFPKISYDIILFPKSTMLKLSHEGIGVALNSLVSKLSH